MPSKLKAAGVSYIVYTLTPNMWEAPWVRHLLGDLPVSRFEELDLWCPPPEHPRRRRLWAKLQAALPPPLRPTRRRLRRVVPMHDFAVFVYNTWGLDHAVRSEFSKLFSRRSHIGIVSVDEPMRDPASTYAHVTFSIRIGFDDEKYHGAANLVVAPLGVPKNFIRPESVKAIDERDFSWSFLGELKNVTRAMMVARLDDVNGKSFVHATSDWDSADSIRGIEYSRVLANSIFVPSPPANVHEECYRTYEALECGAIPVVDTTYYRDAFHAPFPIVGSNWEDAPQTLNALLDEPDRLQELDRKCRVWWEDVKASYPERIRLLAEGLPGRQVARRSFSRRR